MLLAPSSTYCCAPWPTPRMLSRTCSSFDKQIFFLFRIINQPVAELDCEQARSRNERVSRGSKCARFDFVCLSTDAQFIPNRLPSLWGWVYNFNWVETQSDALGKSHRELDVMFVWQSLAKRNKVRIVFPQSTLYLTSITLCKMIAVEHFPSTIIESSINNLITLLTANIGGLLS